MKIIDSRERIIRTFSEGNKTSFFFSNENPKSFFFIDYCLEIFNSLYNTKQFHSFSLIFIITLNNTSKLR